MEKVNMTPMDLCGLITHETVDLLQCSGKDGANSAAAMRTGLVAFAAANGLASGIDAHLAWIDNELEQVNPPDGTWGVQRLCEAEMSLLTPGPATQMDAVWMLFQAAVKCPQLRERNALLELAQTITAMSGLEDTLLEAAGEDTQLFEHIRAELGEVHQALRGDRPVDSMAQACP